jgi:hypothetical protein
MIDGPTRINPYGRNGCFGIRRLTWTTMDEVVAIIRRHNPTWGEDFDFEKLRQKDKGLFYALYNAIKQEHDSLN